MGNWHISIEGQGVHHNAYLPVDANRMARKFVEELKAAGHHVSRASFHHGGAEKLSEESEFEIRAVSPVYPTETEASAV